MSLKAGELRRVRMLAVHVLQGGLELQSGWGLVVSGAEGGDGRGAWGETYLYRGECSPYLRG